MKILKKDLKSGFITFKLETPDDGWKLERVLEEGDLISGKTLRSMEIDRGEDKERVGKKPVFIKISLKKKDFHEYSGKLRLMGKVVEGPEDTISSYHTFNVEEGTVITVEKEWKKWQIERLKKSLVRQPKILVCVMDEREADFAEIGEKMKIITEIRNKSPGKQFGETDSKSYFGEIISFMKNKKEEKIIFGGPGFAKENLCKQIKEKEPELYRKIIVENCSHIGETGVQEIIKKGAIEKIAKESRISEETRLVEDFFGEISKDSGLVTYGRGEVEKAVEIGAVKKLLISESEIKNFEKLMEDAEKRRAEIYVISEGHESGQKFSNIGGIAAFLRFRIS